MESIYHEASPGTGSKRKAQKNLHEQTTKPVQGCYFDACLPHRILYSRSNFSCFLWKHKFLVPSTYHSKKKPTLACNHHLCQDKPDYPISTLTFLIRFLSADCTLKVMFLWAAVSPGRGIRENNSRRSPARDSLFPRTSSK